jgi:heat shock protein HtpX
MGRTDLFPADRGLQLRMVVAAVLTPLLVVAALAALVALLPTKLAAGVAIATAIGIAIAVRTRRIVERARVLGPHEAPELHGIVERLCVAADLPKPELVLDAERQPNSWVIDAPGRAPRLHVTQGLLDVLEPAELEAVVAHELGHVANRDATVMTVVGLPGTVLREGGAVNLGFWPLQVGALIASLLGALAAAGTNVLSRHRELTADAAAARMTGRPAALASALRKLSDELAAIPSADLRVVAGRDAFHLLPAGTTDDGWRARLAHGPVLRHLSATHPSVERRIAALERLERHRQAVRPGRTFDAA